ncbi:CobW family GTP-binding protein [Devriesea agamarum]|uniref:CobW family GTP-binding protein n=1 Tax=Devriesea agamarum TaxID=472569 RepID=UPI00071D99B0|nr:GTP-binding protein [Devriesea agamarum]
MSAHPPGQPPHNNPFGSAAGPRRDGSTPISVIASIDQVLRDALIFNLVTDRPDLVVLRHDVNAEEGLIRRLVIDSTGIIEDTPVELDHPCISCAMREDAVPTLARLVADGRWNAIAFALPLSADPQLIARTLSPACKNELRGAHLAAVCAVVDVNTAVDDLLGEATLAERGICWAGEDERSVGETLAAQLEYADVVVRSHELMHSSSADPGRDAASGGHTAAGNDASPSPHGAPGIPASPSPAALGSELLDHLCPFDTLTVNGLHDVDVDVLLNTEHCLNVAAERIDPRSAQPWGGPSTHGVWTLDLVSERPFHPDRFLANIERLGAGRLRSRGRFWVPSRPSTVCQWDGAGGQVSIGAFASTGADLPTTRLIITGIDADQDRILEAFAQSLLTEDEWEAGLLPWLGQEDVLAPWLGERSITGA